MIYIHRWINSYEGSQHAYGSLKACIYDKQSSGPRIYITLLNQEKGFAEMRNNSI